MKVTIEYCDMWNYYPKAARLAEEIKNKYHIDATLIKSSGGVFEVRRDDVLVFSKKATGRFPEANEIFAKLG